MTIAGAGVLGLAIAVELAGRGFPVKVFDPASDGTNASSVAAGLLAPVGEAVFDRAAQGQVSLLSEAMGLWPAFAAATGVSFSMGPTLAPADLADDIRALDPSLGLRDGYACYEGDGRVNDPVEALAGLRRRLEASGGAVIAERIGAPAEDGPTILAAGPGAVHLVGLAPELGRLSPIKGQIAVLPNGPAEGPTVRWRGGYLVPQPGGARVGATMEAGRADLVVEPHTVAALLERARSAVAPLNTQGAYGVAGVRMTTADGLPLVGPSRTPGVWLATGARRNGWLLAPLVAKLIAAYLAGDDPGPWASPLHPGRFDQR